MNRLGGFIGLTFIVAGSVFFAIAQSPTATYTAEQAAQGKAAYAQNCASCHGQNLDDGEFAPPVKGPTLAGRFSDKVDELFSYVSTQMPPANRGGLGAQEYTELVDIKLSNSRLTASSL